MASTQQDARGVPVSFCKAESLANFETALLQFQSYFGDPTVTLEKTLEHDPEFVLGHVFYAFNDMHAVISLVGAGRFDKANEVLKAVRSAANNNIGVTAMMAGDVGIATCDAMIAFGQQRYDDAIDKLSPIRTLAHRFGGSHVQRDILTQTLTEAAIRSGNLGLSHSLTSERLVHKPLSPLSLRFANKQVI